MTDSQRNAATVRDLYEAFGRGDIPFILDRLRPDVTWGHDTVATEVPWYGVSTGPAAVAEKFFAPLAANLEFHRFEPRVFVASGNEVAVSLNLEASFKRTGERVGQRSVHFWEFDADGKVASYRGYDDTALGREIWSR